MCFIVEENIEHTAEKDIVCYKTVIYSNSGDTNAYKSIFKRFIYEPNVLNAISKLGYWEASDGKVYIEEGFHSYKTAEFAYNGEIYISPNESFEEYCNDNFSEFIAECTIPKGSKYYVNEDQYVSDQIIFNKLIDTEEFRTLYEDFLEVIKEE